MAETRCRWGRPPCSYRWADGTQYPVHHLDDGTPCGGAECKDRREEDKGGPYEGIIGAGPFTIVGRGKDRRQPQQAQPDPRGPLSHDTEEGPCECEDRRKNPHCHSCGEHHPSNVMCPPYEVRSNARTWLEDHKFCMPSGNRRQPQQAQPEAGIVEGKLPCPKCGGPLSLAHVNTGEDSSQHRWQYFCSNCSPRGLSMWLYKALKECGVADPLAHRDKRHVKECDERIHREVKQGAEIQRLREAVEHLRGCNARKYLGNAEWGPCDHPAHALTPKEPNGAEQEVE